MKTPPRDLDMNTPNLGNTRHINEYTNGDDHICDQLEIHEDLQLWYIQDECMMLSHGTA